MNWELIRWFAGICLTIVGLKFVLVMVKTLFSKEMMQDAIGAVGDKISDANYKMTNSLKRKMAEKKARREAEKEKNKPMVFIR